VTSIALSNVKKLYAITALTNVWFFTGSWLYFYRMYLSDRQIGVLDGLVFGVGLIAEIPSGALADLLGRKNQLKIGLALMSVGFISQGLAQSYVHILLGMLLFTIGIAFISGSDDALVYDSLDAEGLSGRWEKVIARKYQIMLLVSATGFLAGGGLYIIHFRLPYVLCGIAAFIAVLIATNLHEIEVKRDNFSLKVYAQQNADGMKYLFRRHMWLYAFMAIVVLGSGYAFDVGIIKPLILDKFNFYENAQAIINTIAGIGAILVLSKFDRLRKLLGEKRGLILLAVLMGAGFLATSFSVAVLGLVAFFVIYIINTIVAPWLNDVVQHEVPSSHRATALSTLALLQKLPYVVLAPLAGILSTNGDLQYFLFGVSLCILLTVSILLLFGILSKNTQKQKLKIR